jgi:hypothetical protein
MSARPDLMPRIERILADPNLQEFTARDVADFLAERPEHIWECLKQAADIGWAIAPKKKKHIAPKEMFRLKWRIGYRPFSDAPLAMFPPEEKPKRKPVQCPVCGRPLKRRHGRRDFHDPNKCQMDNIRDIMKE